MRVLVFEVRGRPYALPADAVRHVDDVAAVTPLPFVPRHVDGLVALGGKVLPQIDLGALLALPGENQGPGQLLVLAGQDDRTGEEADTCALRIGAAWRMVRISEGDLAPVDTDAETESGLLISDRDRERLAGMFRYQDRPVFLLRPERLGLEDFARAPAPGRGQPVMLGEIEAGKPATSRGIPDDALSGLAVMVGQERYAFPLLRVQEVYVDSALTPLPDAPKFVGGLSVLRGQPRLVMSLSRLLGVPVTEAETSMVATTARGLPVIFQCSALVGIRRFSPGQRETTGESSAGIDSFLIGADGTVTILLEPDGLIPDQALRRLQAFLPRSRTDGETSAAVPDEERRMLLVNAGSEVCAIDIGCIERVANYAPPTRLPTPTGLRAGMTEIGGRVLPTTDLGLAFGAALGDAARAYVVVRTTRPDAFGLWALAVGAVERLVRVPQSSILGTPSGRLLCGVGRVDNRLVNILDPNALEAPPPDADAPSDDDAPNDDDRPNDDGVPNDNDATGTAGERVA
jgi:chemotaxis signal transduction protein